MRAHGPRRGGDQRGCDHVLLQRKGGTVGTEGTVHSCPSREQLAHRGGARVSDPLLRKHGRSHGLARLRPGTCHFQGNLAAGDKEFEAVGTATDGRDSGT